MLDFYTPWKAQKTSGFKCSLPVQLTVGLVAFFNIWYVGISTNTRYLFYSFSQIDALGISSFSFNNLKHVAEFLENIFVPRVIAAVFLIDDMNSN